MSYWVNLRVALFSFVASGPNGWCCFMMYSPSYFCNSPGHTPLQQGLSRTVLLASWQPPHWFPTEVSGEIGWASATTDKLFSLSEHDVKAHGTSVGRQADAFPPPPLLLQLFTRRRSHPSKNFTPYWQCGFCRLPLQHPLPGAHPSFRPFLVSLSALF